MRPTSDRAREGIFNMLASRDLIDDARVLDLFAGTGALGIEALSRGARSATFVDSDRDAVAVIRTNLTGVALAGGSVVQSDVLAFLRRAEPTFDLAFADPPYAFDGWDELFTLVTAPVVVAESDRELEPPAPWQVVRWKRYGGTVVTLAART